MLGLRGSCGIHPPKTVVTSGNADRALQHSRGRLRCEGWRDQIVMHGQVTAPSFLAFVDACWSLGALLSQAGRGEDGRKETFI